MREGEQESPGPIVVLVVDDHPDTASLVADFLRWRGTVAVTATSVAVARAICAEVRVHAIITDFAMPGEDGIALARWARREYGEAMPIALYTGQASSRVADAIEELGGKLLPKSGSLEDLAQWIAAVVDAEIRRG